MPQTTLSVSFVGKGVDWYWRISHAIVCGHLDLKMNSSVKIPWEYMNTWKLLASGQAIV